MVEAVILHVDAVNGPALRRLESVPEGEGAEASRLYVEHHKQKQSSRFLGMLRGILIYDIGDLGQVIDRVEQLKLTVSKYRDQSGEGVSDSVLRATFQAGTQEESTRDHLALHTERWDTFEIMVRCSPSHRTHKA